MTDMGDLRTFLGLEINRDREKHTLQLSQRRYIEKIMDLNGMRNSHRVGTPADPHIRLEKGRQDFEATPIEGQRYYQCAIGLLMYTMLGTRPDIAYAGSKVSQYSSNPNSTYWIGVKRIFRYMGRTLEFGLCYKLSGPGNGFTDADWGSGEDWRSVGGIAFVLGSPAIS